MPKSKIIMLDIRVLIGICKLSELNVSMFRYIIEASQNPWTSIFFFFATVNEIFINITV